MPRNRTITGIYMPNAIILCFFSLLACLVSCKEQSPKPPASSSSDAVGSSSSSSCIGGVSGSILTDSRDCKRYKVIVINTPWGWDDTTATWMAENLAYAGEDGDVGVCYGNYPSYCRIYGRLYYWGQAMHACPPGWRLPNNNDWARLNGYVRRSTNGEVAKHLKSREGWDNCGPPGSGMKHECLDTFGFAALPGGHAEYSDGNLSFDDAGISASWWSATWDKRKHRTAFITFLSNDRYLRAGVPRGPTSNINNSMSSVRCIKKKEAP